MRLIYMDRKICLITGASSEIGENLVRLLVKDGGLWLVLQDALKNWKN
ncbi:MAG: hypothetical protein ACR5KV_02735 [Wolbachia sp.]